MNAFLYSSRKFSQFEIFGHGEASGTIAIAVETTFMV